MLAVEAWVVERGVRVVIRGVCNGQCHMGNTCQGKKADFTIDVSRVERLGFELSIVEAIETVFEGYPELIELVDH